MIHTFEQRPPQIQAVQFDGTNAEEVAGFSNTPVPTLETDDSGTFITLSVDRGWMGIQPIRVNSGDWVTINGGLPGVMGDESLQNSYRQIS